MKFFYEKQKLFQRKHVIILIHENFSSFFNKKLNFTTIYESRNIYPVQHKGKSENMLEMNCHFHLLFLE